MRERERAYWALVRYIKLRERDKERERESITYNTLLRLFTSFADIIEINGDRHLLAREPTRMSWFTYFEKWFSKESDFRKPIMLFWASLVRTRVQISDYLVIPNTNCTISVSYSNCVWRWCCFYQFTKNI